MATRMATSTATSALTKQPASHLAASTTSSTSATASFYNNSSPQGSQHYSTKGQQIPNRFTQAFHEMKEICPNSISLYASCVLETERSQTISRHSCSKEFRQVKDCFRKVRGL